MAELNENKDGVFGGVEFKEEANGISNPYFEETTDNSNVENVASPAEGVFNTFEPVEKNKAITKQGLWSRVKAFLFQEIDLTAPIKIELTPYQQKVEDEINAFLHQEITFKGIANFFKGNK